MNWRTILLLMPLWAAILPLAYMNNMSFWDTVLASIVAGILLSIVGFIALYVKGCFERLSKEQMFSCCFVDHDPPQSQEIHRFEFYPIPIGQSEHWLKVLTSKGLNITDFNVRFLSKEEAARDPDDRTQSPEDITPIIQVQGVQITPEILNQGVKSTQTPDRHGGIDIKLDPPYAFAKNRSMFLLVKIDARKLWSGKNKFSWV